MGIREYVTVLRRRWLTVALVVLLTLAASVGVSLALKPEYTATSRLFFGVQGGESVTDLAQGSTFTDKQMTSYAEVASSPLVLDRVVADLRLNTTSAELARSLSATRPANTVILEITARASDGAGAARIANAVSQRLAVVAGDLSPQRPDGSEAVRATILEPAQAPVEPSSPNILLNLAVAALLGLLLGISAAVVRHVLDTRIRNGQDVADVTTTPILGIVPFDVSAPDHPVAMHDDPLGARSEAVRRLRTNLQFVGAAERPKSIVISSSIAGEGKTTTAINLGVSLADAGLRVILVDADLRRPAIADYLGLEGGVGLTSVLIGQAGVADVVQPWMHSSLDILPSGQVPPNPSELLGSTAMSKLIIELTDKYDLVLLDSPPLLPVVDAVVLSRVVDGALVVVGADRIHKASLKSSITSLDRVEAKIFGLVLNKISKVDSEAYVYESDYALYPSREEVVAQESRNLAGVSHHDDGESRDVEHAGSSAPVATLNGGRSSKSVRDGV